MQPCILSLELYKVPYFMQFFSFAFTTHFISCKKNCQINKLSFNFVPLKFSKYSVKISWNKVGWGVAMEAGGGQTIMEPVSTLKSFKLLLSESAVICKGIAVFASFLIALYVSSRLAELYRLMVLVHSKAVQLSPHSNFGNISVFPKRSCVFNSRISSKPRKTMANLPSVCVLMCPGHFMSNCVLCYLWSPSCHSPGTFLRSLHSFSSISPWFFSYLKYQII